MLGREVPVRERRNQAHHPKPKSPELLAIAFNQVWSRDITKLFGPVKWTCFYRYVILDIFSRYMVGWLIAPDESSVLAMQRIAGTCEKQNVLPGQLTIHADRGSSMKSKPVALLLGDLGITKSHSRPYVSDDNPYPESQFETLKCFVRAFRTASAPSKRGELFARSFPLVQRRAPPQRDQTADSGNGPLGQGRTGCQPVGSVIELINPILRGRVNYFAAGNPGWSFGFIQDGVKKSGAP
jgi:transposase InsO family protein